MFKKKQLKQKLISAGRPGPKSQDIGQSGHDMTFVAGLIGQGC
jgi:hypothetical protein